MVIGEAGGARTDKRCLVRVHRTLHGGGEGFYFPELFTLHELVVRSGHLDPRLQDRLLGLVQLAPFRQVAQLQIRRSRGLSRE